MKTKNHREIQGPNKLPFECKSAIRVLHVLNSRSYSGAENVVCTIIRNMPSNYQCIYLSPRGTIEKKLTAWDIDYYGVESLNVKDIKQAFAKLQPDIVHAHDFRASVLCAAVIRKKIRFISHIHCNPPWINRINRNTVLYCLAALKCSNIITVSDAFPQEYRLSKAIREKVTVLGNPFSTHSAITLQESEKIDEEYDAVYVGRLEPEKRPLVFLKILYELKEKFPNISAVVVGDGSLRQACEKYIEESGLDGNVSMVGFQENPYQFMDRSRFLVMPSEWEGFGLVALEAMALGKPVIASAVGGLRQIVADDCGMLCTSKQQFVQEAVRLLTDEDYYNKKSGNAKRRAEKYNNISQYIEKLVSLYGEQTHES